MPIYQWYVNPAAFRCQFPVERVLLPQTCAEISLPAGSQNRVQDIDRAAILGSDGVIF